MSAAWLGSWAGLVLGTIIPRQYGEASACEPCIAFLRGTSSYITGSSEPARELIVGIHWDIRWISWSGKKSYHVHAKRKDNLLAGVFEAGQVEQNDRRNARTRARLPGSALVQGLLGRGDIPRERARHIHVGEDWTPEMFEKMRESVCRMASIVGSSLRTSARRSSSVSSTIPSVSSCTANTGNGEIAV